MCKKLLLLYLQFLYIYKTTPDLHFKVLLFPRRKDQFCCEVGHFWRKKKCLQYGIQLIFHFVHIIKERISSLNKIETKFGLNTITQMCVLVAQSCLALCNPMDCSPPGSSVHGILQARMLEWVAISFSRGSPWPRDGTRVSWISGRLFTIWDNTDTKEKKFHFFQCLENA